MKVVKGEEEDRKKILKKNMMKEILRRKMRKIWSKRMLNKGVKENEEKDLGILRRIGKEIERMVMIEENERMRIEGKKERRKDIKIGKIKRKIKKRMVEEMKKVEIEDWKKEIMKGWRKKIG